MDIREILTEYSQNSYKLFSENLSLLLGSKVDIHIQKWQKLTVDEYFSALQTPFAFSKLIMDKGGEGEGLLVFSKRDAIFLGCTLSMFGKAVIEEKITSLEFGKDEFDAFHELCNQLIGMSDQVFAKILPEKIHIKQIDVATVEEESEIQKTIGKFFNEEYLINFSYRLEVDGKYEAFFDFVLPASFISQIGHGELKEQEEEPEHAKNETIDSGTVTSDKQGKILLINISKNDKNELETLLTEKNMPYNYAPTVSTLQQQMRYNNIKLIVIQAGLMVLKGIHLCRKLKRILAATPVPLWIEGKNWNVVLVRQAIQSGANYIVVLPLNRSVVGTKIQQFCLK